MRSLETFNELHSAATTGAWRRLDRRDCVIIDLNQADPLALSRPRSVATDAGVLVWNRQRFIKDPNTGKRVSRPNPEVKWIRAEVPELRIVDGELWQRVKLRQAELAKQFEATTIGVRAARAERLNRLRRPAFLLSGLLTCGCCGDKYGIVVNDRCGCLGHFRKGICDNGRTIRRGDIERRVLAGLTDKLVSPEAVAVAVRAYPEETNRQNHERRAHAETSRRALEKIDRGIKGILDAIEDGMY